MLQQIDRDLWVASQPLKFMGLPVGTRMTVIRLADNSLLLISPIEITSQLKEQLDNLGSVKYLIAPNLFHHLYLEQCQDIYTQAIAIAPPGLSDKRPNLRIDRVFTQDKIDFNSEVEYTLLAGFQVYVPPKIQAVNEIVFYHPSSKTLIITDSAFNFDDSFPWITKLAATAIDSYKILKPSWLEKIAIKDKHEVQKSIQRILSWDFERVIMAHGSICQTNAKQQLSSGYHWLIS